ncbi:MAG: TMEM198/TM7SF3 family protein [Oscillatoriales cyanobacterium RM1_1_9]|nr:TMEM198/TM7SF3 family protein [Oscillatoriales cyanobacterium SM2_3_0]NJO44872.1 TMEM198/TM7SF3 family protein [Oscillatoriales cyanobacterium RM2_1_1]NJO71070.1 TMEM198/TM7SF3 family protein [Oscillatoriales cyanobacterium RM1_1_9]
MVKTLILAIFSALFGGLFCFGGYRLLTVMLPIWVFFSGLWLGAKGFSLLLGEGFLATTTGLTVGVGLGVFLAIFSWQFYEIGIALLGGISGAWLASGLMQAGGIESGPLIALGAGIVGMIAGVLTFVRHWQQYWVIVLTAISGANAILAAILLLMNRISLEGLQGAGNAIHPILQDSWLWLLIWLAVAIAGTVVQWRSYRQFAFVKEEFVKYWS